MRRNPIIMITGAHGFVGTRAMAATPGAIAVPSALLRGAGEPLREFVRAHRPEVILNAAAISDIGTCERDPEGSYAANVTLPVVLAEVAREIGAKPVSFSSDQVYTGCTAPGPYREDEPLPPPTNVYARHKLEAEARVLEICPDAVLLRATWMYDMPMYGDAGLGHANRGNFLVNTLGALLRGQKMRYSAGEHRGITYVRQVVGLLPRVYDLPGGVYNYGSENELTMPQTARALLAALGQEGEIEEDDRPRHNLWMDCTKLRRHGICFDTTAEGFARCVRDYGPNR